MVTERLNNIHILRGLASLAVCWARMTAFHPINSGKEPIQTLGSFGVYGVQIFFIISGYVISRSLHQIHGRRAGHRTHHLVLGTEETTENPELLRQYLLLPVSGTPLYR